MAVRHALDVAGLALDQIGTFDFYSCFPIAVFNLCDGLGLAPDDPRGLALTGGLPFFGGAGNNYSMHAIAETVTRLRTTGGHGLVGANGGSLSKYSVGIYSTTPAPWRPDDSATLQAEIDSWEPVEVATRADGPATIETFTITHGPDGRRTGIVVGRLDRDHRRFLATTTRGDTDLLDLLAGESPFGEQIFVRATADGNRAALSRTALAALLPARTPSFRGEYDHVLVRRDGHLLEVTINRPQARNALHPPANAELDEVFDAYFTDPDLWVAIITGAGDTAFSAGNDLLWTASGKHGTVPLTGFAGRPGRRHLTKPVIAAVNGYALGGGCEIALACHLVVADTTAQFALSEVRVGLVAGAGGLIRLPRTLPPKLATEMILTGRRLNATEAHAHGLVNRVVPAGTALDGARALAAKILAGSPTSVRVSLQIMNETAGIADPNDAIAHDSPAMDDLLLSEDMTEGLTAFAEKRTPTGTTADPDSRPAQGPPVADRASSGSTTAPTHTRCGLRPVMKEEIMSVLDRFRLDGRVAIVTGASSGLGVDFACSLAEAGADIALGARRVDRLATTARLVEKEGRRALAVATDIADPASCDALVTAAMEQFGRVDILVNNAGIGDTVPALKETSEQFRSVIDVNLNGCYWMAQATARIMKPGSNIVNIASVLGLTTDGLPHAAYTASKAALIGLTRDLAQ